MYFEPLQRQETKTEKGLGINFSNVTVGIAMHIAGSTYVEIGIDLYSTFKYQKPKSLLKEVTIQNILIGYWNKEESGPG